MDRDVLNDAPAPCPGRIRSFLSANHVVGLATSSCDRPWAASCFYAFDAPTVSLIVMTSDGTRHGAAMLASGWVAGTVAGQPTSIRSIQGVQFLASAMLLSGDEAERWDAYYCNRHPVARLKKASLWQLLLQEVVFTDNAHVFGWKTRWLRPENGSGR